MAEVQVHDNPYRHRYEAHVEDQLAGFAEYQLATDLIVLTHTEVDPAYEGQGVGGALARAAMDDVRARHVKAPPLGPTVRAEPVVHLGGGGEMALGVIGAAEGVGQDAEAVVCRAVVRGTSADDDVRARIGREQLVRTPALVVNARRGCDVDDETEQL